MSLQCGRPGFDPWVGKIPWRRKSLPTSALWPGKFQGLCSPQGRTQLDTTERLSLCSLTQSKLAQTRNGDSEARNLITLLGKIVFFIPVGSFGFPGSSDGKASACNAGNPGSIPGLGRSPGEGKGYPLQCSGLENSIDCIVHEVQRVGHDWVTSLSLEKGSLNKWNWGTWLSLSKINYDGALPVH